MYIPAWPTLGAGDFLRPAGARELPYPLDGGKGIYFYVARSGIYHLGRALAERGATVLMPDYHCGIEVWALKAAGVAIRYYRIGRDLTPDLDELADQARSGARALYVIHYFGWPQPIAAIRKLCRERGVLLIEDCALSLLSRSGGMPLGAFGDFSIFCLFKTLPVPNGGVLVQNEKPLVDAAALGLTPGDKLSTAGRVSELIVQRMTGRSKIFGAALLALKRSAGKTLSALGLQRLPVGDSSPDFSTAGCDVNKFNVGMSPISDALLRRIDYASVYRRRRGNYLRFQENLRSLGFPAGRPLADGVCPLFFPLLTPDKHAAALALRARGIDAVELWNYGYEDAAREAPDVRYLRERMLTLPIHQDVSAGQIDYMAEQIARLEPAGAGRLAPLCAGL